MISLGKIFSRQNKSNSKLWSSSSEFDEAWKNRISKMASFIDVPGVVVDLGCGMMWLEGFLSDRNSYLPIDYIRRDERTTVVDFNKDPFPPIKADVAFLSGSLEYVVDVRSFINTLTDKGFKQIVLSYCTIEKFKYLKARQQLNWVNSVSIFDILTWFTPRYNLTHIDDSNGNTLFVFHAKVP